MELGVKLLNSLRIEILERLQGVSVVDGAAHTQKDDVESNGIQLIAYTHDSLNIGKAR